MSRYGGGVHLISPSAAMADKGTSGRTVDGDNDAFEGNIRFSLDEADVKAEVARSTLVNVAPGVSGCEEQVLGPVRGPRQVKLPF